MSKGRSSTGWIGTAVRSVPSKDQTATTRSLRAMVQTHLNYYHYYHHYYYYRAPRTRGGLTGIDDSSRRIVAPSFPSERDTHTKIYAPPAGKKRLRLGRKSIWKTSARVSHGRRQERRDQRHLPKLAFLLWVKRGDGPFDLSRPSPSLEIPMENFRKRVFHSDKPIPNNSTIERLSARVIHSRD